MRHALPVQYEPKQFSLNLPTIALKTNLRSLTRPPENNLFFALVPDPLTIDQLFSIPELMRVQRHLTGRMRPSNVWHISLIGLGRYEKLPEAVLLNAKKAANSVRLAPFDITFDHLVSFNSSTRNPLVLGCEENTEAMLMLRKMLGAALASVGFLTDASRSYTPHLTLLYDWKSHPEVMLNKPIKFRVREFVLIHSLHGRTRHVPLGRWRFNSK